MKLLAIGYEEISGDCLDAPDVPPADGGVNAAYRAWLIERYGVTIPATASNILGEIPNVLAEASADPFWCWVRKAQEERDSET